MLKKVTRKTSFVRKIPESEGDIFVRYVSTGKDGAESVTHVVTSKTRDVFALWECDGKYTKIYTSDNPLDFDEVVYPKK